MRRVSQTDTGRALQAGRGYEETRKWQEHGVSELLHNGHPSTTQDAGMIRQGLAGPAEGVEFILSMMGS